jgi:hypothetical protein
MTTYRGEYPGVPEKKGLLAITAQIHFGREISVAIAGDRDGLRYLAGLLLYFADLDVEQKNLPEGERAHIHLHPGYQLIEKSCDVEVCRAEAKGTGELPTYFKGEKRAEPN